METLVVILFAEGKTKALEGLGVLRQLDKEGEIAIFDARVIVKTPNGPVRVIDQADNLALPLIGGGGVLGALLGLMGGPVGVAVGAAAGAVLGSIADIEETGVTNEFVGDVSEALQRGEVAVVADIDEDLLTPLDTRMEELGGVVLRRTRTFVKDTQNDRDAAVHRAEMDVLTAERLRARADRLARIDASIDQARQKLEAAIERKRAAMMERKRQRAARIRALQTRANQSEGELRKRYDARISALRRGPGEKGVGLALSQRQASPPAGGRSAMEKMIVIVFDDEAKALDGLQAVRELDSDGEISVFEVQVVAKTPDGGARVIRNDDLLSVPMLAGGTAVGAILGLIGGPLGVITCGTAGAVVGAIADAQKAGLTDDFVGEVSRALKPGKVAVVADIMEEAVTPLDERIERIGGVVLRRMNTLVETTEEDLDAEAHRAEMQQLKAERARARAGRLEKIDARIDHLGTQLENAIQRRRGNIRLRQQQREARIERLQSKARQSEGEVRLRQEARIAALRRDYSETRTEGPLCSEGNFKQA